MTARAAALRLGCCTLVCMPFAPLSAQTAAAQDHAAGVLTGRLNETLITDGGSFAVELRTVPDPIRLNEYFELLVHVAGNGEQIRDGQPLVVIDASMPKHAHGMNTRPQREPAADDRYVFTGMLFHMAGDWEIRIEVARGRIRETALAHVRIE